LTASSIWFRRVKLADRAGFVRATKKRENQRMELMTGVEPDRIENTAPKGMNDRHD
jgi:hypothetical protein